MVKQYDIVWTILYFWLCDITVQACLVDIQYRKPMCDMISNRQACKVLSYYLDMNLLRLGYCPDIIMQFYLNCEISFF